MGAGDCDCRGRSGSGRFTVKNLHDCISDCSDVCLSDAHLSTALRLDGDRFWDSWIGHANAGQHGDRH